MAFYTTRKTLLVAAGLSASTGSTGSGVAGISLKMDRQFSQNGNPIGKLNQEKKQQWLERQDANHREALLDNWKAEYRKLPFMSPIPLHYEAMRKYVAGIKAPKAGPKIQKELGKRNMPGDWELEAELRSDWHGKKSINSHGKKIMMN
jgi:hypothetical protein